MPFACSALRGVYRCGRVASMRLFRQLIDYFYQSDLVQKRIPVARTLRRMDNRCFFAYRISNDMERRN